KGAAPIVVVGTTRDPATPYRWAQALADQLASAPGLCAPGAPFCRTGNRSGVSGTRRATVGR
ncbi:alpha/beta hydrolase, partial [Streptomyces hirsutus]|uniref:alpha/beta hydrolase n=1 Tax=Streptomyces hirsutus TaxID=35620 RepID=UPI0033AC67DA